MTSVNTNAAALTALRTLQNTNSQLESVQSRISTGLKIGEAKDNAAYWSIATTLKSDNKSLSTVKDALGLGSATVDVAYQGLNKAKDVLDEIKSKLTAATQDGVDRSKIQAEISELQKQLTSIASSSTFSGENWLSVDSSAASYNASKSVVSSFSRDASGAVSIGSIDVNITGIKLFDKSGTADGILDTKSTLKNGNTTLTVGGLPGTAGPVTTALQGLTGSVSTGSAGNGALAAKAELGTLNMSAVTKGDVISFQLTVDGTSNMVSLKTDDLAADGSDFVAKLQLAVTSAVGAGKATVAKDSAGVISISAAGGSVGTSSTVSVGAITTTDGDGAITGTAGILGSASLPGPAFGTATKATTGLGTYAPGTQTVASHAFGGTFAAAATTGDKTFILNITYGDVTKNVSVTLANDTSANNNAASIASQIQTRINAEFTGTTYRGMSYTNGDITVKTDMTGLETAKSGAGQKVVVNSISGTENFGVTAAAAGTAVAGTGDNLRAGDTVAFNVQYGSTVRQITHTFQASDFTAGGIANGWATANKPTADEWKTFLQTKIDASLYGNGTPSASPPNQIGSRTYLNGDTSKALYSNGDLVVKNTGGVFTLESKSAGDDQAVGLTGYTVTRTGVQPTDPRFGLTANSSATTGGAIGYGTSTSPKQAIGTFDDTAIKSNDTIKMTVNVSGVEKTISVKTGTMLTSDGGSNTTSNTETFRKAVQTALDNAFGSGAVTFKAKDTDSNASFTNKMTLTIAGTGTSAYLAISNVTAIDGDGVQTAKAGLTAGATNTGITANGKNVATAATAALTSTAAYTSPITVGANDTITLNLSVDNVAKTVVIDRARVDAALGSNQNGVIADASAYATVLNSAFTNASPAVAVTASFSGNNLVLTRNGGAVAGTLEVTGVTSASGANLMSVDKIDVSDAALTNANVTSADRKNVFAAYISLVNDAINKVTSAAASLGSVASRIDMQKTFVNTLMDTIEKGVGNLVDADMTEESTKLQALQVKSQLGVQSLSIANQSAQSVLSLFRG